MGSALQIIQLLVILANEVRIVCTALGWPGLAIGDETTNVAVIARFGGLGLLARNMSEEGWQDRHAADDDPDNLLGNTVKKSAPLWKLLSKLK